MSVKGLVLVTAVLLDGVGVCFGQRGTVQTITIEEVDGKLTVSPSFVNLLFSEKAGTFRWVSRTHKADFRIEFFFANPCNPKTSHLDRTPAICNVLPNNQGTYMYQIVRKGKPRVSTSPIALARVGSCEACGSPTGPKPIGIACDGSKTARAVPPDFTVTQGSAATWIALGRGDPQWSVKFDNRSPCKRNAFDAKNPACEVTGAAGQYSFTIKLDGCANSGKGQITVK